jgi:cell division protein FtsB
VVARRRALVVAAVTVILLGVLVFAVFPTRTWWQQRQETAELEAELADVRAELAQVNEEQERMQTPAEIERRAREDFGYVNPGEEAYNILPAPAEPIGLPEGWPFTGVERAFGAS